MQNHVDAERARLFRAARAVDREIAIEARLLRDADHAAIHLTENRAVVLAQVRYKVEHLPGFFWIEKTGGSVGSLVGICQVSGLVILSVAAGAHVHDRHDKKYDCRQKDAHAVQTVWKAEYEPEADTERSVRHRRRGAAVRRAAFGCPCLIVVDELRKIAARIEKRGQRDRQKTGQRDLLFLIDGASSFHKRQSRCL